MPICKLQSAHCRAGITLLEVLISMFILLIGLLGVASLIPVGKFEVQRGAKIDRAAACGRAAFRDIKVRGMLNPRSWALADTAGTAVYSVPPGNIPLFAWDSTAPSTSGTEVRGFVIDPLGVGDVSSASSLGGAFPKPPTAGALTAPRLPRLTLGPGMVAAVRAAAADALFRWQDDLVFETPDDVDKLPTQVLQGGGRRLSQGDYSWLVTAIPDGNLVNASNWGDVPWRVSVAVYYKRELGATANAGERMCDVPTVTGAGEVTLSVLAADPGLAAAPYNGDATKFLDVKAGQWLMIAGTPDATAGPTQWRYSWQRIVAVDAVNGLTRAITLSGADQPFFGPPAFPVATFPNAQNKAFLFDGIIAVYEKNMKLELDSIYQ